jgi:hypothetical protein
LPVSRSALLGPLGERSFELRPPPPAGNLFFSECDRFSVHVDATGAPVFTVVKAGNMVVREVIGAVAPR